MTSLIIFIFKCFIMGIVEGVTEFLPVSSTAHLIITQHLVGFNTPKEYVDMFEVVIQLGAILAIVVLYWEKIWNSLKNLWPGKWGFKLWLNVIVGTIPAAILGFLLKDTIESKLKTLTAVALAMIVGGVLLIIFENKYRKKAKIGNMDYINLSQAFIIGCFQCLSLWPGMSRSASTIMGSWIVGLNNIAAAEFSFFLAIPAMIGASILEIIKMKIVLDSAQIIGLAVGFLVSFIVALFVVEGFVSFLKKRPMKVFSYYRIIVGIIILIIAFI